MENPPQNPVLNLDFSLWRSPITWAELAWFAICLTGGTAIGYFFGLMIWAASR